MRASLPLSVFVLLTVGCQSPAPLPPAFSVSHSALPVSQVTNLPVAEPGEAAATLTFLRTLQQTITSKRNIDRVASQRYRQIFGSDPQAVLNRLADDEHPRLYLPRSTVHAVTQIEVDQEAQTAQIVTVFKQQRLPPSCQNLLGQYERLLTEQVIRSRRVVVELRPAIESPTSTPLAVRQENRKYAGGFALDNTRRIQRINQEIAAIRNASSVVAAQVPLFRIEP